MKSSKSFIRLGAAFALAVLGLTGTALAQDIRVSYETSDTHLKARTFAVFKEEIEKSAGDTISVKTFPSSSLVTSNREVTATIRGQVGAAAPFISYFENITPKVKVLTTPLIFKSYDQLTRAMDGDVGKAIYADLESKGLKPLGFWYETPTLIFTSNKKVETLEQLKGLKIRTYPSETLESMLTALGANPAVIPGSEVYLALQNGTVDGAVTTPDFAKSLKLDEVLRYAVDIKLVLGGYIFVMNKELYEGFTPEQRKAVDAAAATADKWNQEHIQAEIKQSLEDIKKSGVEVVEVSADEEKKWEDAMTSVYSGLSDEVSDMVDKARGYE